MDVIELECPHCGDELELDAAFAGSVCRCSTCGTLMTVPADPKRERSEKIARKNRPDAPGAGARPDAPSAQSMEQTGASVRAEAPGRPDAPSARPDIPSAHPDASAGAAADEPAPVQRPESPVAALPAEHEVFVTDKGKAVKIQGGVPTARKRKKETAVNIAVIAGLAALILVLVVAIIFAINLIVGGNKPKAGPSDLVGVDPNKNPIVNDTADILGVPIAGECAIILDGTGYARQWFPMMREIVAREVALAPQTEYMIIAWTDIGTRVFGGDKAEKIDQAKLADLDRFLSRITTVNDGSPVAAAQKALDARADQLLIVTGRALEFKEREDLKAAVAKRVDTRVDVIVIEGEDAAMGEFAKENGGQYVRLKNDVLKKWYDAWKKGAEAKTEEKTEK